MSDAPQPHRKNLRDVVDEWETARKVITALGGLSAIVVSAVSVGFYFGADGRETLDNIREIPALVEAVARIEAAQAAQKANQESDDAEIRALIRDITGASRVTVEGDQIPFVRKPVHLGDDITLVVYIGRTAVGAGCILREIVPVFVDANGIPRPGEALPPRQQIGTQIERREVVMPVPENTPVGQTSVQLQLQYQCGDSEVFESTAPVPFDILPERA